MKIHIGSDHAGLEFKAKIIEHLKSKGHQVDPASFGIVLGGSGNGEQMAANKVKGVRAALVWSIETAKLAREHNNANVISIGGRMHDEKFCLELVDTFLATPFTGDERHVRRISQISKFESEGKI